MHFRAQDYSAASAFGDSESDKLEQIGPLNSELQRGLILHCDEREFLPILLEFIADPDDIKAWLEGFATRELDSNADAENVRPSHFTSFLLTASGYSNLGFSPSAFGVRRGGSPFMNQLDASIPTMTRPGPHAMILLESTDEEALQAPLAAVLEEIHGLARATVLRPNLIRVHDDDDPAAEIVYRDVLISRLLPVGASDHRFQEEAGSSPLMDDLLVPDPFAERSQACGGYFVLRRMPSLSCEGERTAFTAVIKGDCFYAPSLSFFRSLDRY